jgi:hypothetical protein
VIAPDAELLLTRMHGHIALLAVALCYHPWVALRRARLPSRAARLSAYLATGLLTATLFLGFEVYPEYRIEVRRTLYATWRPLGLAFEFKEHVGSFAVALTWAGAVVTVMSARARLPELTPVIARLYGVAAVLATLSAVVGVYLATVLSFPYAIEP